MKNNMKALYKGLSVVALAVALAACGGGGGGDETPATGGGSTNTGGGNTGGNTGGGNTGGGDTGGNTGGGNGNATVVSYSAYLPNSPGQGFDRLVDIETRDGKASVVIDGVEQNYTLTPINSSNTCSVSGGTGDYKIESCATRSRGEVVMLCPTAADLPIAFLQNKEATYLTPTNLAELRQVAINQSSLGGLALNVAFCSDSLITIRNRLIVLPNGSATITSDGVSELLSADEITQLFSSNGFNADDAKAGMKVFKWQPEVAAGAQQTVRYIVILTGVPFAGQSDFTKFEPVMFVTPATLQLPAR